MRDSVSGLTSCVASLWGNLANFVVGALVGYMGYRTACNSGLLYRLTYGNIGALLPVLFLAMLTIGWQGIVVGAFGLTWAGSFDSPWFVPVAIFAGLLYTWTTYYGVKGLERVGLPSTVVLVIVGVYAGWYNIDKAGGWAAFLDKSGATAALQTNDAGRCDQHRDRFLDRRRDCDGGVHALCTPCLGRDRDSVHRARDHAIVSAVRRRDGRRRLRQF